MTTGLPARAHAFTCWGRSFWTIQRSASQIAVGAVVQHEAFPGETGAGKVVFRIDEMLRGKTPGTTITFEATGDSSMTDGETIGGYPVGSEWVFIFDGGPFLRACTERFLRVDAGAPPDAPPLSEIRTRVRRRGPPAVAPLKTPGGAWCNSSLVAWLECGNLRLREYFASLRDYEAGMYLKGIALSDRPWELYDGTFVGRVPGLEPGFHIYVVHFDRYFEAYAWIDPGGRPQTWPLCAARTLERPLAAPDPNTKGYRGSNGCAYALPGIDPLRERWKPLSGRLEPGPRVVRCGCLPESWLKKLRR